jgi:uncharacterized protein YqjF (DUF2071 family)
MKRTWIMTQKWDNLLFAHWPVSVQSLRPFIPEMLELDTYDGYAWIGVIAFEMSRIRLRCLPDIPFTAPFPEINVRTYVKANKRPGVFFMTLDASNPFIIQAARIWYRLPYYRASMFITRDDQQVEFQSDRIGAGVSAATFRGRYRPASSLFVAKEGTIEHWLMERYVFYCQCRYTRQVYTGEIAHEPWLLQHAETDIEQNTMTHPFHIELPKTPTLSHYSSGTQAFIGGCRRLIFQDRFL